MIKKVILECWPEELNYIEGEVTADDVIVGEVEKKEEHVLNRNGGHVIIAKRLISISAEVDEVLGLRGKRTWDNSVLGTKNQRVSVITDNGSSRAQSMMQTRFRKEFEAEMGDEATQKDVETLVNQANREIAMVRDNFVRTIAQNVSGFKWDRQEEIDILDTRVGQLRDQIGELKIGRAHV